MRILSIYYTHKPGGFCTRLYRLLGALAQAGHEVTYLCLDDPGERLVSGVRFNRIPFPFKWRRGLFFWLLFLVWSPLYLFFFARRCRPERFAVFGAFYAAVCRPTSLLLGIPITLFLRSLVFRVNQITGKPRLVRLISDFVDRLGMRGACHIVVMSESMLREARKFIGSARAHWSVLPNDIPPRIPEILTPPTPGTPLRLFSSGVLDARKNVQLLLEALSILKTRFAPTSVHLTIAGDGPLLPKLQEFAQTKGIGPYCTFLGWVEQPACYLRAAHLVLHPSLHEGTPNAVVEALAHGIPVLCSRVDELQELLIADELLFDRQTADELVEKLARLIEVPSALHDLNRLCKAAAQKLHFDWDSRVVELVTSLNYTCK